MEVCRTVTLTPLESAQALAENKKFPFKFQRNLFSLGAQLSIPVFNGFQRERRVQEAAAARNDARYNERARELQLETDITAACLNLVAAIVGRAVEFESPKETFQPLGGVECPNDCPHRGP
ncbi:MAG: TolC family protein [Gemmatimonadaceae bacterium]